MRRVTVALGLLLALPILAAPAVAGHAQRGDLAFQFRLGGFVPDGEGEFWAGTEQTFTLDESDFNDGVLGFSLVGAFGNHLEAAFNADFYEASTTSAVRGFVDSFGFPILHDTRLAMTPLTVDLRVLPTGRYRIRGPHGRQVSKPVLYVGGGMGLNFWEYEEIGDFVDFTDDTIFFDRFRDDGVALQFHVLVGVELPVSPRWGLLFEGRRTWADDTPGGDFAGLGTLDLDGTSAYVGGSFRF